ncbi:MAG: hypothetical protein V3T86_03470 [Planctomycetota bacterium]
MMSRADRNLWRRWRQGRQEDADPARVLRRPQDVRHLPVLEVVKIAEDDRLPERLGERGQGRLDLVLALKELRHRRRLRGDRPLPARAACIRSTQHACLEGDRPPQPGAEADLHGPVALLLDEPIRRA